MPANVYECMFILDTNKVGGDIPAAAQQLHAILERHHAEILASRPWDERRLAYPIGNHKKGLYYLAYFRTEGKNLAELKRDFGLNEMILRNLILRIHPKWVDAMLALARDEHAVALQTMQPESTDEIEGSVPVSVESGPPRRGGRRHSEEDGEEKE